MSSKWCCVLAVVCLPGILWSLDADAQPSILDIRNLQQNIDEIRNELTGVKRQLANCGCASAKSTTTTTTTTTTTNPIHSSTQFTHGTSCLVLIIVRRPTEYHANEIGSLTLATCLSAAVLSN